MYEIRKTTMTSLNVPEKFYQVCRLCLTVVSDTKALKELSVFRTKYDGQANELATEAPSAAAAKTNVIVKNVHQSPSSGDAVGPTKGAKSNANSAKRSASQRNSRDSTEDLSTKNGDYKLANSRHQIDDEVCNNNNIDLDNRDYGDGINVNDKRQQRDGAAERGDNYGNDDSQLEILEQIHTFLAISVSLLLCFCYILISYKPVYYTIRT